MTLHIPPPRLPFLDANGQVQRPWTQHLQQVAENAFVSHDNISPTGAVNGSNKVFTLPHAPNPPESLRLYVRGSGGTTNPLILNLDYTLTGSKVTMIAAPASGGTIHSWYRT